MTTETYRPRVPNWIRASAVHIGYSSVGNRVGAFCYERLLDRAARRLEAALPVTEILVRGSRPGKAFHFGLSDIDLIVVTKDEPLARRKETLLRARDLVAQIRRGWHPLSEVLWLTEGEKQIFSEGSQRHAALLGCRSYREGLWRSRGIPPVVSLTRFEVAMEKYLDGFWFWHIGQQKRDPSLVTLSHVRKLWCDVLAFLNECQIETGSADEFRRRKPTVELLGELCARSLRGLERAALPFHFPPEDPADPAPALGFIAELDWVLAHQKHLHRKYAERSEKELALTLDATIPFCYVVPASEIEASKLRQFLKIGFEESASLRHAFLFPLLTPQLARYYRQRHLPRNQNRRYLHGATSQWTPMPSAEWEQLAWDAAFQISGLFFDPDVTQNRIGYDGLLHRLQACPDAREALGRPKLVSTLATQTELLAVLTG